MAALDPLSLQRLTHKLIALAKPLEHLVFFGIDFVSEIEAGCIGIEDELPAIYKSMLATFKESK